VGAGLAADNLMNALYFAVLFGIARTVERPKEDMTPASAAGTDAGEEGVRKDDDDGRSRDVILQAEGSTSFDVLKGSYALSLASIVCAVSAYLAGVLPGAGLQIPIITLLTVFLATAFPKPVGALAGSG